MKSRTNFVTLGAITLGPTVIIWLIGFLALGVGLSFAQTMLASYHSMPQYMQMLVEGGLPLVSIGLSFIGLMHTAHKGAAACILTAAVLLAAVFGIGSVQALKPVDATPAVQMSDANVGERCGGNMTTARACAPGLHCASVSGSHLPMGDVGGVCVSN